MISVSPTAQLELDYRVFHYLATAMSGHVLASSREGQCSLAAPNFSLEKSFHLPCAPKTIALTSAADLVGFAGEDGRLQILDVLTQRPEASFDGSFEAVAFSPDDNFLWSVSRLASDLVSVKVHNRHTWRIVRQADLEDPFGESYFDVHVHPQEQGVALWAAAGQDGQAVFFARTNGAGIEIARLADVNDTTPPCFNRTGDRFLISVESSTDTELRLYSFPECALLGTVRFPENEAGACYAQFAGDHHALVQWGDGQLYLADLRSYSIVAEVVIVGHEPRPIPELYPSLKDDTGIGTDLCFFQPYYQGGFISVHDRLSEAPEPGIAPQRPLESGSVVLTWQLPALW